MGRGSLETLLPGAQLTSGPLSCFSHTLLGGAIPLLFITPFLLLLLTFYILKEVHLFML